MPSDSPCTPDCFANPTATQTHNGDKDDEGSHFIGCFHKTLPHSNTGIVDPAAFRGLRDAGLIRADAPQEYEAIATSSSAPLVNPIAGLGFDRLLPSYCSLSMGPAPKVKGKSTAAEMVELYWMALLRDLSFSEFRNSEDIVIAAREIKQAYDSALTDGADIGKLTLTQDLPGTGASTSINPQNVFRCGLKGEELGPAISQFFLKNIPYGAQFIDQRVIPYKPGQDYLTDPESWLYAQNSGKDGSGRGYAHSRPNRLGYCRPILTMRDLATFVNQDALHQAYFNAALILDSDPTLKAAGLPYQKGERQTGFVTFGGPHLLTLVSGVASRAMKVVWHQKWQVHLRLRPEAYGGLLELQHSGTNLGLDTTALDSEAHKKIRARYGHSYLPMPYPSGSPAHPAYGAGHATVAGACVTILKAWFKGSAVLHNPVDLVSTESYGPIDMPSHRPDAMPGLPPLLGTDLTVEGELNKLASNVALGRSMGGVHWRSDNTRSLRLGEDIAIVMLARELNDLADKVKTTTGFTDPGFESNNFNGEAIVITASGVTKNGAPATASNGTPYDEFLTPC